MTSKCIECGKCKDMCPAYIALKNESASPRAKGMLENRKALEKVFYLCTLCEGHKESCPIQKLDLDIVGAREKLVRSGVELPMNKAMIENLRKWGNPHGKNPASD